MTLMLQLTCAIYEIILFQIKEWRRRTIYKMRHEWKSIVDNKDNTTRCMFQAAADFEIVDRLF